MKCTHWLTLAALVGALAAPSTGFAQQTEAERAEAARLQKQEQDAERAKGAREKQQGEGGKKVRQGKKGKDAGAAGQDGKQTGGKQTGGNGVRMGERIDASRMEDVRKKAALQRGANKGAAKAGGNKKPKAADAEKTKQVNDLTRHVRDHRVRMAEMGRLEALFAERGDREKVARVEALRQQQKANYERTMARYQKLLGKDDFAAYRRRLRLEDK